MSSFKLSLALLGLSFGWQSAQALTCDQNRKSTVPCQQEISLLEPGMVGDGNRIEEIIGGTYGIFEDENCIQGLLKSPENLAHISVGRSITGLKIDRNRDQRGHYAYRIRAIYYLDRGNLVNEVYCPAPRVHD